VEVAVDLSQDRIRDYDDDDDGEEEEEEEEEEEFQTGVSAIM
jgi:hypothetical protein